MGKQSPLFAAHCAPAPEQMLCAKPNQSQTWESKRKPDHYSTRVPQGPVERGQATTKGRCILGGTEGAPQVTELFAPRVPTLGPAAQRASAKRRCSSKDSS